MPTKHAILGPSSASRWLACTPSARFEEQLLEEESPYAREGTLAHDIAALVLSTRSGSFKGNNAQYLALLKRSEDEAKKLDLCFSEMHEHAEEWARFVLGDGDFTYIGIEKEYDLSAYVPLGFGTADATAIIEDTLFVSDYKYGAGVRVSPTANKQLMLYALGACLEEKKEGHSIRDIMLGIFQPRAGGGSSWKISAKDLLKWAEDEVKPQALKAIAGVGDFVSGSHCQFCKARTMCKAYYDRFAELKKIHDKRVMKAEETAAVLTYGPMIASWAKKVGEEAVQDLAKGKKIPGFKLVAGRGRRSFRNEDDVVDILIGEGLDSEEIFNSSLKSLTDFEKKLGAKKFKILFADEVLSIEGKAQLAEASDPRPSVGASAADEYEEDEDLT